MTGYLIGIGDGVADAVGRIKRAAVSELVERYSADRLLVMAERGVEVLPFANGAGAVIGHLFRRFGDDVRVHALEPHEAANILDSKGRLLIEQYWGSYIAVLRVGSDIVMLRDPSGALPCSYVKSSGDFFAASDPRLLRDAGLLQRQLDWRGVARSLYLPSLPTEGTAIKDLMDLLPGTALIGGLGSRLVSYWDPWRHVSPSSTEPSKEHERRLRSAVISCAGAWNRKYGQGMLAISGGLDSSIVAAALVASGNKLTCMTLATPDPIGDERGFCRTLASSMNVGLYEDWYDINDVNLSVSAVAHRPRPHGRLDSPGFDAAAFRAVNRSGASAIFTGNGGDNVFYLSHSARSLVDRYFAEGLSPGLWRTMVDIATLTGASLAQVIKQAVQLWPLSAVGYRWRKNPNLLSQDAVRDQEGDPDRHPWLESADRRVAPGKAAHIAMLLRMQHSVEAYSQIRGTPVVHPLVSQPVVEACLAVPTWHQVGGGRDRSVARAAFADLLPPELVARSGKGSPQGFAYLIFHRYREELRQRLLEGRLASSGILDRSALEGAFARNSANSGSEIYRLMLMADTESWVENW